MEENIVVTLGDLPMVRGESMRKMETELRSPGA